MPWTRVWFRSGKGGEGFVGFWDADGWLVGWVVGLGGRGPEDKYGVLDQWL